MESLKLPSEVSEKIIKNAIDDSVIMQKADRVTLSSKGTYIPVIGELDDAKWQTERGGGKPEGKDELTGITVTPYYLCKVITLPVQAIEDDQALYSAVIEQFPKVIGRSFDRSAFGLITSPSTGFNAIPATESVLLNSPNAPDELMDAEAVVGTAGGEVTDYVLSQVAKAILLKHKTGGHYTYDRPFHDINGVPITVSRNVYDKAGKFAPKRLVGMAGDFSACIWGQVGSTQLTRLDEAAEIGGKVVALKQHNLMGFLAEMELGFYCADPEKFFALMAAPSA